MTEHILQLADGRKLGYACYGAADARPVLYFHGTPSSRLEPNILDVFEIPMYDVLQRYNLRLIAIDRPGMGLSSFQEERTLVSFADDVAVLMQLLRSEQCPLLC